MRTTRTMWILLTTTAALTAVAAAARFDEAPQATDAGATLRIRGGLVDLATSAVTVRVRARGMATVTCTARGEQTPSDARRTRNVRVTVTGAQTIPASHISNGATSYEVTTGAASVSPRAAGCGNGQGAEVSDVRFQEATLRVMQKGRVVLTERLPL